MIQGTLPKPPRFLTRDEVLTIHELSIEAFGGTLGVRDAGLLDAALAMPQQAVGGQFLHHVPFGMSAAYAFHLCQNHPFIDGNKRVAFVACHHFLHLNGWKLGASSAAAVEVMLGVAEGLKFKSQTEEWIALNVQARPTIELRDFLSGIRYEQLAAHMAGYASGSQEERVASMLEAGAAIPAIHEANLGAVAAERAGDNVSAGILRQHATLLTAFYQIAEDSGYEW